MKNQKPSSAIELREVFLSNESDARVLMQELGVSKEGVSILSPKTIFHVFEIKGLRSWEANIIKQHLLSLGSDAALDRQVLIKDLRTKILLFGTNYQLGLLSEKLKNQPFSLKEIAYSLEKHLTDFQPSAVFRARDKKIKLFPPAVCGIINVTPDSFSGDGALSKHLKVSKDLIDSLLFKAEDMVSSGAQLIDIGGESTRPFSKQISQAEEIKRVVPVIKAIRKKFPKLALSIDSYKYKVVQAAVEHGIDLVNDITALRYNPQISSLIKKFSLGCVLMHMQGMPQTMQKNPKYECLVSQVRNFLEERVSWCEKKGILRNQLAIDPGIGFGKTVDDNFTLLRELKSLRFCGTALFIGLSRKSFIGKILNQDVSQRLIGTVVANTLALINGAQILRVHDVKEACQAVKMVFHS